MSRTDSVPGLIEWAEERLREARVATGHGTSDLRDEAAWLVLWAVGLPVEDAAAVDRTPLAPERTRRVRELVEARIRSRQPTAYLTGEAWFAGLPFTVDERVIVPRSHIGEWLPEGFAPWVPPGSVRTALDLCTGSGCIAVTLALVFPGARVDAVDVSPDALEVARVNIARHDVADRVAALEGDLFEPVAGRRYDLIVCNPPYVAAGAMEGLPPEYRHEPALALAAGPDGLDIIRRILPAAASFLHPGGHLVLEAGSAAAAVQAAWPRAPFTWLASNSGEESPVLLASREELAGCSAEAAGPRP